MRLIDIINAPWAITPDMLSEVQSIYARHLRGEKIDLDSLSASTGINFASEPKGYTVQDGVAVLPIDGVIAKRMNLFSKISGGVSSELVGRDFQAAMADRSVEAIVLAIDSPGGTVDGTPELAQIIHDARGTKPILACTDGMMCSAAYWIGCAADQVFISSEVAMVGSIGVVAKHLDVSKAEEKQGIKTTEITAGKYKRAASQYGPLTDEGKAQIQEAIDHVYAVFVEDVAKQRGTDVAQVLTAMADGRVFHGSQAINAGLVDGVSTLAATINKARELARAGKQQKRGAGVALATNQKEHSMDIKTLKEEHPDLVAAIVAEAQTGISEALATAKQEGAAGERQRISDVRAQIIPGHEALIEQLAFDGKSTGAEAAMAMVGAEKSLRERAKADILAEGNALVPAADSGDGGNGGPQTMKRADFNTLTPDAQRQTLAAGTKLID
ncbi:MAG: signal peptide peptidase SppA [Deltaproteobacteria bacterium]|nr:signal peptide peptidase SppA [Deltaproteobacteria bacterium]